VNRLYVCRVLLLAVIIRTPLCIGRQKRLCSLIFIEADMHSFSLNHLHYKKFDSYVPIFLVYCGKLFAYMINHVFWLQGKYAKTLLINIPQYPILLTNLLTKTSFIGDSLVDSFHDHDTETCAYMLNRPKIWTEQRHQFPIKFQSLQIAKFLN